MSFANELKWIREHFLTNWNSNTTPVKLDNVAGLVKGSGSIPSESGLKEWVWLTVVNTDSQQASMGDVNNRQTRHFGTVVVNVFVKSGTGIDRARELANLVKGVFQYEHVQTITFRATSIADVGEAGNEGWYQVTVRTPFFRDEV